MYYLFSLFTGGGNSQYNSLYPGNSSNITLLLSNYGDDSTFLIHISHDNISSVFYYNSSQTVLTVKENRTAEIIITVTASKNATDGDRISFIVTASTFTTTNQRSDFVSFLFVVSTLPPPTQIENVSEGQLLTNIYYRAVSNHFESAKSTHFLVSELKWFNSFKMSYFNQLIFLNELNELFHIN